MIILLFESEKNPGLSSMKSHAFSFIDNSKLIAFIVFYFLIIVPISASDADRYRFINFTAKDGFPDKFVYDIAQDNDGFIWIGGNNGLYCYDGIKFKRFSSPFDRPDHQIANILEKVYFGKYSNRLWLSSLNTIQWFDLNTYKFGSTDTENNLIQEIVNNKVTGFCEYDKNHILISTQKGICYNYEIVSGKVKKYYLPGSELPEPNNNAIRSIHFINNDVWVVCRYGIFKLDPGTGNTKEYALNTNGKKSRKIITAQPDHERGLIWLACGTEGYCGFDINNRSFTNMTQVQSTDTKGIKNNVYVKLIEPVSQNQLLIADGGLGLFNIESQIYSHFIDNNNDYDFKTGNTSVLFTDRQGNLWIGSYYSGLSLNPFQNRFFKKIEVKNNDGFYVEPYGLTHVPGTSDFIVSGILLNGIAYYDSQKEKLKMINPSDGNNAFSFSAITSKKGNVYVTVGNDIYRLTPDRNKLIPLNIFKNSSIRARPLYYIIADDDDNIYAGSDTSGLFRFNVQQSKLEYLAATEHGSKHSSQQTTLKLSPSCIDSRGNVWVTNSRGVFLLEKNSSSLRQVALGKAVNTGAVISQSGQITEVGPGHYLISTISSGLFEYFREKNGELIINHTVSNTGLSNDFIINAQPATPGKVWLLHLQGLSLFDLKNTAVISNFTSQNGLVKDDGGYNMNLLPDGRMLIRYFGYINIIDTKMIPVNPFAYPPVITSFQVMDNQLLEQPLFKDTTFRFSYRENLFRIEFATLNFSNSNENHFKYKLEGVDNNWLPSGKNNTVNYSGLPPGTYVFRLRAANNDSKWNTKELSIIIKITPPFWKSWWFVLILIVTGLALFILWNQTLIKNIRREQQLKSNFDKQIAEMELKALRAQMNPHFIFNSLNSIQKYVLNNDQYSASQYLTKFSRLIRLILDHSVQNNILLSSELDMLKLYIEMELLRFDNRFGWQIEVDKTLKPEQLMIPAMLIQPYVENAIWHGLNYKPEKGFLKIEFAAENSFLKVTIDDNGIGRKESQELKKKQILTRNSYGMKITENRMLILKKVSGIEITFRIEDKIDANGNAAGTKVIIAIPLENNLKSNPDA